jgi:DNA segregation ATPase FtsK/SpoIIIE, S-DNA-T family
VLITSPTATNNPPPQPAPEWMAVVLLVAGVAAAVLILHSKWRRKHRPNASPSEAAHHRWVRWVASRWMWDAQNLGLCVVDDTTRHRRQFWTKAPLPPVKLLPGCRFYPAPNGLRAVMATVPGVGLKEVMSRAEHLANSWGCVRVDVTQIGPGHLQLRGHLTDPLARPWAIDPSDHPISGWQLDVGVDDEGSTVHLPLANLSGITVAGVPGTGKTSLQRWWLCQLAPHPAVQIAVLDGKVSDPTDGDYGPILSRCFASAGDDLDVANGVLQGLWQTMRDRSTWLRVNRGTAQFWEHGPTTDCPVVFVVVDESHTFVTAATKAERELCESNAWYLTKLAKEGRSRGFITVFVTQKQTADAIPTAVRDVCQVGISFGVRTMDGAVAALGDEIRQYPEIAPTTLIGREWSGVAVMRLPDRTGYHRVRTPFVAENGAAGVISSTAPLTRSPSNRTDDLEVAG